jgi:lipopolysaccharide/colanic/teichoic acid biosynthesis glycosyltransferase
LNPFTQTPPGNLQKTQVDIKEFPDEPSTGDAALNGVARPAACGRPARLTDTSMPDFWPAGLEPRGNNPRVTDWLLGRGEWAGQSPGWKHYEIPYSESAMQPATWPWRLKRLMDLSLTIPGLALVSPVMLLTAIALKISAPGEPVLFKQYRPGYLCKPFRILKFRTMRSAGDSENPTGDAERITKLGKFLRRSSLDELPQLFNIINGQMSLVGPRPQLSVYLTRYKPASIHRHGVLPGIVGENQVRSRNDCEWSTRMKDDLHYVANRSIIRDLYLAFYGPIVAALGRGTTANGTASMVEMSEEGVKS